ncbi:MAG: hypothetical protein R3E58_05560 [Phycisphaerae bacterium]
MYTATNPGGSQGTDDVDGGTVIVTSPLFDLGAGDAASPTIAGFMSAIPAVMTVTSQKFQQQWWFVDNRRIVVARRWRMGSTCSSTE